MEVIQPITKTPKLFNLPKLEKIQNFEISNSSLSSAILGRPKKHRIDRTLVRTGGIRNSSDNLVSPTDMSGHADVSCLIHDSSSDSDEEDKLRNLRNESKRFVPNFLF